MDRIERNAELMYPFRQIDGGEVEAYYNAGQLRKRELYEEIVTDIIAKAEEFFNSELYVSVSNQICSVNEFTEMKYFIEQFKQYITEKSK